jgi:hypothetical protein
MTPQTYTPFEAEKWANKLNAMLSRGIIAQCTNTNYTGEIKELGDSVICKDESRLVVDRKKFFAFKINNMAEVQASESIMEAHLENARRAIKDVQEQHLCSLHNLVSAGNTVGTDTEPIQLNKKTLYKYFVELALKLLKSNNEDSHQRPWVIINPLIESYLLQTTEFIGEHNIADAALREGAIGRIAGMDVLVTSNLTDTEDLKYYILAGTNEAITFASQLAKIETLRDKDSFSDLVRGLYLYSAKTVKPESLAKMVVRI